MEDRGLNDGDDGAWKSLPENFRKLFSDPPFRSHRSFCLRQNVESKLTLEDLVFDLLKVQKIHRLFLKLIDAGVATLRGRLEHSNRRGLHGKSVMEVRQHTAENHGG